MRKIVAMVVQFIFLFFCSCTSKQKAIHFIPVDDAFFNFSPDSSLMLQRGKNWEERKRFHDSCMGESIYSNALFVRMKDTFRLGTVINRNTLKVEAIIKPEDFPNPVFAAFFNMYLRPCYSSSKISYPIDSFLNQSIYLKLDSADEKTNISISQLIASSVDTEVEIGSWYHIEFTDFFSKALDTVTSAPMLEYKKALLNPDNVVLTRSANITEISFRIKTPRPVQEDIVSLLATKPIAKVANSNLIAEPILINEDHVLVIFRGVFQFSGTFMKAELEQ